VVGLLHEPGVPSRVQVNVAVESDSVHANVDGGALGSVGFWVRMGNAGAVVSTVHDRTAGEGSMLPAASVALTVRE
jgi:hypothetical protein